MLFKSAPQASIYPLWKRVHGEDRLSLPALPQFLEVLSELGTDPRVETLPPQKARGFDSREMALEELGRRLYLAPGGPEMADPRSYFLPDLLEEVEGDPGPFEAPGHRKPVLVTWCP